MIISFKPQVDQINTDSVHRGPLWKTTKQSKGFDDV